MLKRLSLIATLLTLPLGAPAHDWTWLPPQPATGVNPCRHNACPYGLQDIYDHLVTAQLRQDTSQVRHWTKALDIWYAFNPDYRPHLHPHK